MPTCPNCGSQRTWKDGLRYTINGNIQRYVCRECGTRFSESSKREEEFLRRFAQDLERQDCDESSRGALVSLAG
ncbi:MAG: IS1/IS1595 family N-terminal zinc-binding domain-containing protein, partial [Thermoproteota archaeon]